jgi:HAD superfamily hydrolase (TIGR01484 family)
MKSLAQFSSKIKYLFTDIDDTLTLDGQLPAESYQKIWELHENGVAVIPVTGRPAGWCEMIARMWPVLAVIGENGALTFQYKNKSMERLYAVDEKVRIENQRKLKQIENEILAKVPGCALASDQFTRLFDLAIDFCEDVTPLEKESIQKIVDIFHSHGATAKVSSIHVNGWFGDYDKRSMCENFFINETGQALKNHMEEAAFIGDSPNDEPLFEFFGNSVAVANILNFKDQLKSPPRFVTEKEGAHGFVELANKILTNLKS